MTETFDKDYFMSGIATGKSNYEDYRWLPELTIPMAKLAKEHIGIQEGDSLLDFGASRGFFVKAMRSLGINAKGFDISEWAVENCDPDVSAYVTTDFELILNNAFDYIWSKDTLEHISTEHLGVIIPELFRSAVKGLFIIVPLTDMEDGRYIYPNDEKDATHIQRRTLPGWCWLIGSLCPDIRNWNLDARYLVKGLKASSEPYDKSTAFIHIARK